MTNLKYEVWMNDIALSSLSPAIFISGIAYKPATKKVNSDDIAGRDGERIENVKYKGATVTVSFILRKTATEYRQDINDAIVAWATKGILRTSDRPWKRLRVLCVDPPYIPDTCDWTTPISMTFKAFEYPFWEDTVQSVLSLAAATSGSGTLYVPGSVGKALVEVTVTPSSSMANITLTVGNTSITLTGVSATSSASVTITYDDKGIQQIMCGSTSILDKRTGSDDLLAECGKTTTFSFTASAAAAVTFMARGQWL